MIEVKDLHKSFGKLHVLKGINFTAEQGEVVVIIGPSGMGKSTFLRCLNCIEFPEQGSIEIDGVILNVQKKNEKQIRALRQKSSMVFQNYNVFKNKTVLQNVMLPMTSVQKMKKEEAREFAVELLQSIGLKKKADEYPSKMSGGEQQRVGILRAAATNPQLMLLDEPTSSLDPELVGEVQQVILSLTAQRMTMLLTTHEMNFAKRVASKVLFLSDGKIGEQGTPEQIFDNPQTERLKTFLNHYRGRKIL